MDLNDREFETQLRDEFEPRAPRPLRESPPVPHRRRRRWLAVAAIAAVVFLVVLIPARALRSAPAVLQDGEGSRKIHYGDVVRPSGDASALLAMVDGSLVEMRSRSELSLERADDAGGIRILLSRGDVIVNAPGARRANLYVRTRHMTASVDGTMCLVKAEDQGSRVVAIGGEVLVRHSSTEQNLRPGEQFSTSPMELLSVGEEVSWSRNAKGYVALLQQAAVPPLPVSPTGGRVPAGADARSVIPADGRALIEAAAEGKLEAVRLLLDQGADPNVSVPGEGSPLIVAAREGRAAVVTLLLDRGANIDDIVPGDENPLIMASREGKLNVVRLLVSRGADVNAKAWSGPTTPRSLGEWRTPLSQARKEGRSEVVQFLISAGARE